MSFCSFLFAIPALWPRAQQSAPAPPPPPVALQISGPGAIHVGQEVSFKIVLVNLSAHPILIADRGSGALWSNFSWNVVSAHGKPVPTAPINPKELLIDEMGAPLGDDVVYVLEPCKQLVYKLASDPTVASCFPSAGKLKCMNKRVFPAKGQYVVWLHYLFVPHGEWDYKDTTTGLFTLSPANIELLKATPPIDVLSNRWTFLLE